VETEREKNGGTFSKKKGDDSLLEKYSMDYFLHRSLGDSKCSKDRSLIGKKKRENRMRRKKGRKGGITLKK